MIGISMKTLSSVLSFFVGVLLASALLVLSSAIVARYFITKLTALPPKPTFTTKTTVKAPPKPNATAAATPKPSIAPKPSPSAKPVSVAKVDSVVNESTTPKPSLSPSPQASPKPPSPTDGYRARVVQPIGLVLRDNPTSGSAQVGGIDYNQQVTVLEQSPDGVWIRVRLEGSQKEGWVKAGNTEKVN